MTRVSFGARQVTQGIQNVLKPRTQWGEVMRLCHDVPSAGHQGVTRSKERLRQSFYWWRMSGDIKDYVQIAMLVIETRKVPFRIGHPIKFLMLVALWRR